MTGMKIHKGTVRDRNVTCHFLKICTAAVIGTVDQCSAVKCHMIDHHITDTAEISDPAIVALGVNRSLQGQIPERNGGIGCRTVGNCCSQQPVIGTDSGIELAPVDAVFRYRIFGADPGIFTHTHNGDTLIQYELGCLKDHGIHDLNRAAVARRCDRRGNRSISGPVHIRHDPFPFKCTVCKGTGRAPVPARIVTDPLDQSNFRRRQSSTAQTGPRGAAIRRNHGRSVVMPHLKVADIQHAGCDLKRTRPDQSAVVICKTDGVAGHS